VANQRVEDLTLIAGNLLVPGDRLIAWDVSDSGDGVAGGDGSYKGVDIDWIGRTVYKTADQSNSSNTTLADVTDLAWTVEASKRYVFEFNLFVVAAATTTGLVVAMNGPTIGAGAIKYAYQSPTSGTATFYSGASAYDTALVATGVPSTSVPHLVRVIGYFKAGSTDGTLTLRMRSEVNASNATILEGSSGTIRRVA